jgi:hypothetical protein
VKAGFIDCLPTEMIAGKIQPGMVSQHPAVISARTRHDELRGRSVDISGRQENRRHIADLERTLGRVVEAAFD